MKKHKKLFKKSIFLSALFISVNISAAESSCHNIEPHRSSCLEGRIDAINDVLLFLDKGDDLIQYFNKFTNKHERFMLIGSISDSNDIYKCRKAKKELHQKAYELLSCDKTYTINPEIYKKFPSIDNPDRARIIEPVRLNFMDRKIEAIEHVLEIRKLLNNEITLQALATRLSIIEEELIKQSIGLLLIDALEPKEHWGPCIKNAIKRLESSKNLNSK